MKPFRDCQIEAISRFRAHNYSEDNVAYKLVIPQPQLYFSLTDEAFFFDWIKSINVVLRAEGRTGFVILHLSTTNLDDVSLKELLALMTRYGLDMSCLRSQCNELNEHWFKDASKYWHKSVFGIES